LTALVLISAPALLEKTHDPAFQWKVYGFLDLLERGTIATNFAPFSCCGYTWALRVNPMHKRSDNEMVCVALSLAISQSNLRPGYIINAVFELSVFNHSKGTYWGVE
ncbi:hypothetical protein EJB05_21996, partial [Eragrostis curvula]